MNKVKGELDYGELFDESFEFKHITWKVPNALSLPDLADYEIKSPPFSFANATWNLLMYPYGRTEKGTREHIDLLIYRSNSQIPEHHVIFQFHFKTSQGKEFQSIRGKVTFNAVDFQWGILNFIRKSEFKKMKDDFVSNGILTIICEMRIEKITENDKNKPIESNASLLGSDGATESQLSLHDNKILSDFKEIFLKQEDCDVIIKVKGKEFPAHKIILKARSPVLASTFRNDMKEKSTGIIDIEDCDPDTFSNFLIFLYSGDVENLSVDNVFSLFTTSDKYDVQYLRKKCLEFIKEHLSVDTFCDTISLAVLHGETELVELSTEFFAKNLQEIIVTVKWQVFLAENTTVGNELLIKALVPNKSSK